MRFDLTQPSDTLCCRSFWRWHMWWLLPAGVTVWGLQVSGLDHQLARFLYAWQGYAWHWRDSWLLETLIHRWAKYALLLAYLALLVSALLSRTVASLAPYRRGLWYLVLALPLGTLVVSWLKSVTAMDCPWDLKGFGGNKPFIGLFEFHPDSFPRGRCFPAAHASAAYTWFALYFFSVVYKPHWRWTALVVVVAMGLIFGLAQQLRGAHFLSHDLAAAMVSWFVSAVLCVLFFCLPKRQG